MGPAGTQASNSRLIADQTGLKASFRTPNDRSKSVSQTLAAARAALKSGNAQAARVALVTLRKIAPDHPGVLVADIDLALSQGLTAKASTLLIKAPRIEDASLALNIRRALVLEAQGETIKAIAQLRSLRDAQAATPHLLMTLGRLLQEHDDKDAAIACFEQVLSQRPDRLKARLALFDLALANGDIKMAGRVMRSGLAIHPNHTQLVVRKARLLVSRNRAKPARRELVLALRRDRTRKAVHVGLGQAHLALRRLGAAKRYFDGVLRNAEGSRDAWVGRIEVALQDRNPIAAFQFIEEARENVGADCFLVLAEARALRLSDRVDEEELLLQHAIPTYRDHPCIHLALVDCYLNLGKPRKAENALLQVPPGHRFGKEVNLRKLAVQRALNDKDGAQGTIDAVLKSYPDDLGATLRCADALIYFDCLQQAIVLLDPLIQGRRRATGARTKLAKAYFAAGRVDEAQTVLENGLKIAPQSYALELAVLELKIANGQAPEAFSQMQQEHPRPSESLNSKREREHAILLVTALDSVIAAGVQTGTRRAIGSLASRIHILPARWLFRLMLAADARDVFDIRDQALKHLLKLKALPHPVCRGLLRYLRMVVEPLEYPDLAADLVKRVPAPQRAGVASQLALAQDGPFAALKVCRAVTGPLREPVDAALLGSRLAKAGQARIAQRYLHFCRRRWPFEPRILSASVNIALLMGQPKRALQFIEDAAGFPETIRTSFARRKVEAFLELGRDVEALQALEHAAGPGQRSLGRKQLSIWQKQRLRLAQKMEDSVAAQKSIDHLKSLSVAEQGNVGAHFGATLLGASFVELVLFEATMKSLGLARADLPPADLIERNYFAAKRVIDSKSVLECCSEASSSGGLIPRVIYQYWDTRELPDTIGETMASWSRDTSVTIKRFDRQAARLWLRESIGKEAETAFRLANNTAEECDFLRLCLLWKDGGLYADADDWLNETIEPLLQLGTGLVCFREPYGALANNVLAAAPGHPAIEQAVRLSQAALLARDADSTWSKTGPGLLTRAVATTMIRHDMSRFRIAIIPLWKLKQHVTIHMEMPYKKTSAHWNQVTRPYRQFPH